MPWTPETFRRHNKAASPHQLQIGAAVANDVLDRTGDDGKAVAAGNASADLRRKENDGHEEKRG
jgi:hypothetical protein